MHYLIHGDYHLGSRQFLSSLIKQAGDQAKEIIKLNGDQLSLNHLFQATSSSSLFGSEKQLVIENLFSITKSKQQSEMLDWLKNYHGENPIIFWEKKDIGKVLQRRLPQPITVKQFKTPIIVFKLVEQIYPQNINQALVLLRTALQKESAEFLFAMIIRQLRLMLLVKADQKIPGAPWMIGKLKKQASHFDTFKLQNLYQQLYTLDKRIKTGQSIMPLSWQLELLISQI